MKLTPGVITENEKMTCFLPNLDSQMAVAVKQGFVYLKVLAVALSIMQRADVITLITVER